MVIALALGEICRTHSQADTRSIGNAVDRHANKESKIDPFTLGLACCKKTLSQREKLYGELLLGFRVYSPCGLVCSWFETTARYRTESLANVTIGKKKVNCEETSRHFLLLDTQVFVSTQFNFDHHVFASLKRLVNDHSINILYTDVTKREVKNQIIKRVREAILHVRQKAYVLRSAFAINAIFEDGAEENAIQDLTRNFERFLQQCTATEIETYDLPLGPVLEKYFECEPPFESNAKKKSEFPDAMTILAARDWCEKHENDLVVISADKGVQQACISEERLEAFDSLNSFVSKILEEKEHLALEALTFLDRFDDEIVKTIYEIAFHAPVEVTFDGCTSFDFELKSMDMNLKDKSVIWIHEESKTAVCVCSIKVSCIATRKPQAWLDHVLTPDNQVHGLWDNIISIAGLGKKATFDVLVGQSGEVRVENHS